MTSKLITKLTKEQELKIPEFIDKWVNNASATIDKEKAIQYTKLLYKRMGKEEPIIIFGDSPHSCCNLAWLFLILFNNKQSYSQLYSQLRCQLDSQLYSQLYSQLDSQLSSQLRSQLDSQLRSQLHSQLGSQLRSQLDSQLSSQLRSQLDSQLSSQLRSRLLSQLRSRLLSQLRCQLDSQLLSQLGSRLLSQLDSQLRSQLHSQLGSQLGSQLHSQLYSQLGSRLLSQLDSQLGSRLRCQLDSQLGSQLKIVYDASYVMLWWSAWAGFYEYGQYIGVKFDKTLYDTFVNFIEQVHFIVPLDGIAFISEKPTAIHFNNQKQLHRDGEMSIQYPDGWGTYSLNGVRVPEYLAITPASQLSLDFFKKEKNADVKAEFIRKFGIERMEHLGKEIDSYKKYRNKLWTQCEYKLIDMSPIFTQHEYAPFLRMKNQTVDGIFHLEGVHPDCRTIQDALDYRCSGRKNYTIGGVK